MSGVQCSCGEELVVVEAAGGVLVVEPCVVCIAGAVEAACDATEDMAAGMFSVAKEVTDEVSRVWV